MPSRSRGREQALQVLYFMDIGKTSAVDALELFQTNFKSLPEDLPYARHLIEGIEKVREGLDQVIENCSQNWRMDRMPRVDRNILRMAVFEIQHCPDIPDAVAIDEAIELGKKYGDVETGSFINGILDHIVKSTDGKGSHEN